MYKMELHVDNNYGEKLETSTEDSVTYIDGEFPITDAFEKFWDLTINFFTSTNLDIFLCYLYF